MPNTNYVTYQQMIEYVGTVTDPMEEHIAKHDSWHLTQLTNAKRVVIAEITSIMSTAVAIIAIFIRR